MNEQLHELDIEKDVHSKEKREKGLKRLLVCFSYRMLKFVLLLLTVSGKISLPGCVHIIAT